MRAGHFREFRIIAECGRCQHGGMGEFRLDPGVEDGPGIVLRHDSIQNGDELRALRHQRIRTRVIHQPGMFQLGR